MVFFWAIAMPLYQILHALATLRILLIVYSSCESTMMSVSISNLQPGNSSLSFSKNCRACDVWKVESVLGWLSISTVIIEISGAVSVIWYGPSYQGMNFTMRHSSLTLYSLHLCNVDSTTLFPFSKRKSLDLCSLAARAWEILAWSKLSCASLMSVCSYSITSIACISSIVPSDKEISGGMTLGLCPIHSWKGENSVDALIKFIISKHTWGSTQCQPCLVWMSLAPSEWGW